MTPDSSVVVAAFAGWHECHKAAAEILEGVDRLVGHVEIESYSVLTRLPPPFRVEPSVVADYLARRYPGERMVLEEPARRELAGRLAGLAIAGGAVYDALVASTAAQHECRLVSCDRRAAPTYDKLGLGDVLYL